MSEPLTRKLLNEDIRRLEEVTDRMRADVRQLAVMSQGLMLGIIGISAMAKALAEELSKTLPPDPDAS